MGFRKVPTIYTLTFKGDYEGLVVRMKSTSFGKVRRLLALMGDDVDELESFAGIADLLIENLVSWNLEDENGTPVPVNAETFDDQDFAFVIELANQYLGEVTGPSEELGKDSTDGGKFPGRLPTMEAL